jgi:hypothetical protein
VGIASRKALACLDAFGYQPGLRFNQASLDFDRILRELIDLRSQTKKAGPLMHGPA